MGQAARGFQQVEEVFGRFGNSCEQTRAELRLFTGDRRAAKGEASSFGGGGLKRSVGGAEALSRLREDVRQGHSERMAHHATSSGHEGGGTGVARIRGAQPPAGSSEPRASSCGVRATVRTSHSAVGIGPAELRGAGRRWAVVAWRRIGALSHDDKIGSQCGGNRKTLGAVDCGDSKGPSPRTMARGKNEGGSAFFAGVGLV